MYQDKLQIVELDQEKFEILQPNDFIDAFKELNIEYLEEIEIEWLLRVLLKPEIDDNILFNDLVMILENFGIPESQK